MSALTLKDVARRAVHWDPPLVRPGAAPPRIEDDAVVIDGVDDEVGYSVSLRVEIVPNGFRLSYKYRSSDDWEPGDVLPDYASVVRSAYQL